MPWVSPPGTWQVDLLFVDDSIVFNTIDVNSRFAWARTIPNKKAESVLAVTELFVEDNSPERAIRKVQTDAGSEFINRSVRDYLNEHDVELQILRRTKPYIVERFNRTLRELITTYKEVSGHSKKWRKVLPDLLENYNSRVHRTTGYAPVNVTEEMEDEIYNENLSLAILRIPDLKPGDKVRIRVPKKKFDKTGRRWSLRTYTIDSIKGMSAVIDGEKVKYQDLMKVPDKREIVVRGQGDNDKDYKEEEKKAKEEKKREQLLKRVGIDESNVIEEGRRKRVPVSRYND